MALNWDLTAIENSKELCWVEAEEDGESIVKLNPITDCLIWATLFLGMREITKKNLDEFTMRLMEWEKVVGGFLQDTSTGQYTMPSYIDVEFHIGLKTNVTEITLRKWKNKLSSMLRENSQKTIRQIKDRRTKIEEVA
jgi:hypothetical protein|tara:strand:+ start:544 stop:957 length:414 start_codon:yes stop_codon:yes gene_type:complete